MRGLNLHVTFTQDFVLGYYRPPLPGLEPVLPLREMFARGWASYSPLRIRNTNTQKVQVSKSTPRIEIKGGGQGCPPYTGSAQSYRRPPLWNPA
jgi:hypothetical protein